MSEATVDLGHVVEAIKKIEEEGQGVSDEVKAESFEKRLKELALFGRNWTYRNFERICNLKKLKINQKLTKLRKLMRALILRTWHSGRGNL